MEFLSSAVTPTAAYAVLIPALDELVHVYHLDPEVIPFSICFFQLFMFHVILDLINLLKPQVHVIERVSRIYKC